MNLNYEENKDLVMLAIDSFLVLFDDQTSLQIPLQDLTIILCKADLIEALAQVVPKLIYNAENSTILNEQATAEKYLEKAFDVL